MSSSLRVSSSEKRRIRESLEASAGACPMVNRGQLAKALDLVPISLWDRLKAHPDMPQPDTMRVAGAQMMTIDAAVKWCVEHTELWNQKQIERRKAKAAA